MRHFTKGIIAGAAAAMLAAWAPAVHAAPCGDLNGDGGLSVADCTQLLDVAVGPPDPANLCGGSGALQCGDLNGDGAVNTADVSACLLTVSGGETVNPLCQPTPVQIACPGGVKDITADITTSQTWITGCIYRIDRLIKVSAGVTLNIQAGVKVVGKKVPTPPATVSAIIWLRDSKFNMTGTSGNRILFTSDQNEAALGTTGNPKGKGDWGGVVLNGRAPVNVPGGEGLSEGLDSVAFGGNENNDSSGVMQFVQIEFAGKVVGLDNELNILTQNSLGAGTVMDHIAAHTGLDDAFEWFGGTLKSRFLVASSAGDDNLDWQLGYTGAVQFATVWQDINQVETGGSNGIEADNNENNFNATPVSNPKMCNITMCGTADQPLVAQPTNQFGLLLRRGTAGAVANAIVEGFRSTGVRIQHNETSAQFATGPTGSCTPNPGTGMWNSRFFNNAGDASSANITGSFCTAAEIFTLWGTRSVQSGIDPQVDCSSPANLVPPGASPVAGAGTDCSTLFGDAFFQTTNYIGAFVPGGANWSQPWATYPAS
jgi:hypothetical protein